MNRVIDYCQTRTISETELAAALAPYGLSVVALDPTPADAMRARFVQVAYQGLDFQATVSTFATPEVGYALKRMDELVAFARQLPSMCTFGDMFYSTFGAHLNSAYGKGRKGSSDAYSLAADLARTLGVRLHS